MPPPHFLRSLHCPYQVLPLAKIGQCNLLGCTVQRRVGRLVQLLHHPALLTKFCKYVLQHIYNPLGQCKWLVPAQMEHQDCAPSETLILVAFLILVELDLNSGRYHITEHLCLHFWAGTCCMNLCWHFSLHLFSAFSIDWCFCLS